MEKNYLFKNRIIKGDHLDTIENIMARIGPFDHHSNQYEDWFHKNECAYLSELIAVKKMLPLNKKGIEIGVGSGRFAEPLNIKMGIEPSQKMIELAIQRGIRVIKGVAEELSVKDEQFDFALMVTTICFLDDSEKACREIYRILKPSGCIIVGFVNKHSTLGKYYQAHKNESVFYCEANFFSVEEVVGYLKQVGFHDFSFVQTIYQPLKKIKQIQQVKKGYGEGSFIVIRGKK